MYMHLEVIMFSSPFCNYVQMTFTLEKGICHKTCQNIDVAFNPVLVKAGVKVS